MRTFSGKLFNRPTAHPEAVRDLAAWASHADPILRACGANVEHDWRISEKREQRLLNFTPATLPAEDLKDRLKTYFEQQIQGVETPDFLHRDFAEHWDKDTHEDTVLVNIWKLPRTLAYDLLNGAAAPSVATPPDDALRDLFPAPPDAELGVAAGAAPLNARQAGFLEQIFAFDGDKPARHPVWCSLHSEFANHLTSGPDAWLGLNGVTRHSQSWPVFVFRYRRGHNMLVRPGFLDSNFYAEHFPSPPPDQCPCHPPHAHPTGGHPMPLILGARPLHQEFIHADFRRSASMVAAWGWTGFTPAKSLVDARIDHHTRLGTVYNGIDQWMRQPV